MCEMGPYGSVRTDKETEGIHEKSPVGCEQFVLMYNKEH